MRIELSRTYPVSRHRGFDYFMDVGSWGDWTTLDVADAHKAVWRQPGDSVRYTRRTSLPGLQIQGTAVLDDVAPDDRVVMTLTTRGLPPMPIECRFANAGPAAFTLTLTVRTQDPRGFISDALQHLLFLETQTERDMRKCLDGLDKVLIKTPVR